MEQWALDNPTYANVSVVTQTRKALAKQMTAMMMDQWDRKRHICENFSVSTTKCALVCCIYLRSEPAIESV
jgi:hypothetical protein